MSHIIQGKLKLKGSFQKNLDKKEEKVKRQIEDEQVKKAEEIFKKDHKSKGQDDQPKILTFEPEDGQGRILTSSTTIQGDGTKFLSQVKKDDFLIMQNPQSLAKEERKIACVMSDKSLLLYKPFSSDVMSFTQYWFRKQDEIEQKEEDIEDVYKNKFLGLTKKINKEKDSQILEYREKKGMWSYNTVKKEVSKDQSREQLLDQRAKKGRDKFCWF
ncbi:hypothetical protein ABPG72_000371 [Tetrahymena utriculariae]